MFLKIVYVLNYLKNCNFIYFYSYIYIYILDFKTFLIVNRIMYCL